MVAVYFAVFTHSDGVPNRRRSILDDGLIQPRRHGIYLLFTSSDNNTQILEEIFLNLPAHQVVCCFQLVCRQWKEVADRDAFWRERCRREGYHVCEAYKSPEDWRLFYFLCKKRRNLIRNPRGEEGMKDWKIVSNGGDGWITTSLPNKHPDETIQTNFVTSFYMCKKSQMIDLKEEGYNPYFMDHFQPDIKVSDWFISRWDCGSEYHVRVKLLNAKKECIQCFAPQHVEVRAGTSRHWNQMIHVFQNYGPGVRYIQFTHGGKDIRYWKGWFGIHLTETCVEICPATNKMVGIGLGEQMKCSGGYTF